MTSPDSKTISLEYPIDHQLFMRVTTRRKHFIQGENTKSATNIRLVQFSLGTGNRSVAEAIADKVVPAIRAQKGCDRCEFIADHEAGDYGIVVLWASKQAADAAFSVISPILTSALAVAKAKGAPSIHLFEVYEPKK